MYSYFKTGRDVHTHTPLCLSPAATVKQLARKATVGIRSARHVDCTKVGTTQISAQPSSLLFWLASLQKRKSFERMISASLHAVYICAFWWNKLVERFDSSWAANNASFSSCIGMFVVLNWLRHTSLRIHIWVFFFILFSGSFQPDICAGRQRPWVARVRPAFFRPAQAARSFIFSDEN